MSQEITDAMLDEQAEHLTSLFAMAGYGTFTQDPERIYRNVTRTALEVERESLRLLEGMICNVYCPSNYLLDPPVKPVNDFGPCTCGRDAHIQVLRTRLGINLE